MIDAEQSISVASNAITAYPRREELLILNGWDPVQIGQPLHKMADSIEASLELVLMSKEVTTQEHADQVRSVIANVERWGADLEELSKALREPFFKRAKEIKAASDSILTKILLLSGKASNMLAEFEAEKIRTRERLERQAREEAQRRAKEEADRIAAVEQYRQRQEREEAERLERLRVQLLAESNKCATPQQTEKLAAQWAEEQRKAEEAAAQRLAEQQADQARLQAAATPEPVFYNPEKTEGTSVSTAFEYDVTDSRAFAEWIWRTGKDEWVREIQFDKRSITAWLNCQKLPHPDAIPTIPGLNVRRVAKLSVQKAPKAKRPITAATTRVEM